MIRIDQVSKSHRIRVDSEKREVSETGRSRAKTRAAQRFSAAGYDLKVYPPWPAPVPNPKGEFEKWLAMLRVVPDSAIEWILDPWFLQGPRVTSDVNWMWIPDGRGEVLVGPNEHRLRVHAGDHVFLPAGTRHIERFPMHRRWRMLSMHFLVPLLGGLDFLAVSGFPLLVRGQGSTDPLGAIARRLCREYANRAPGWLVALRAGMEEALLYVMRHHGKRFTVPRPVEARIQHRLLPVFQQVEARLADRELTIGDLARVLHVSEVRFRRLFREATGLQPVRFIQRRRIELACRRLTQSDLAIKEIAMACGFHEMTFFHRVFRRWTGVTPAAYRSQSAP